MATDLLGLEVLGHVSVEPDQHARRVVESHFPEVRHVSLVQDVDDDMVRGVGSCLLPGIRGLGRRGVLLVRGSVASTRIGKGPCGMKGPSSSSTCNASWAQCDSISRGVRCMG